MQYLGYLEAIDRRIEVATIDGPDDEPLRAGRTIWGSPTRLRLSALTIEYWREIDATVDALPLNRAPTDAERQLRLQQLRKVLRDKDLPRADIFVTRRMPFAKRARISARLGSWYGFATRPALAPGRWAPVFLAISGPEGDAIATQFLTGFSPVNPDLATRLRDVFSLAHIADWAARDGERGPTISPPLAPGGGDIDGELPLRVLEVPANSSELDDWELETVEVTPAAQTVMGG